MSALPRVIHDPLPRTSQDLLSYLGAHTAYIELHHAQERTGVVTYRDGAWRAYRASGPGYGCGQEIGDTANYIKNGEQVYLGFATLDEALHAYAEDAMLRGR